LLNDKSFHLDIVRLKFYDLSNFSISAKFVSVKTAYIFKAFKCGLYMQTRDKSPHNPNENSFSSINLSIILRKKWGNGCWMMDGNSISPKCYGLKLWIEYSDDPLSDIFISLSTFDILCRPTLISSLNMGFFENLTFDIHLSAFLRPYWLITLL
jgi:hypothetical protein